MLDNRLARIVNATLRRSVTLRGSTVLAAMLSLAACGDDPFQVIEETEFAPSLGVDLSVMERLPSGVYLQDDPVGTGDAVTPGQQAAVDFSGWLADGTLFDSGDFSFMVAPGGAIDGFVDGVVGMRVGGTRLIVIPPELAWAERGSGSIIPPGAVVVFRVTLEEIVT